MTNIPTDLNRSLNMHIGKICPFKLGKDNTQNHCAHYVSHMMGYELAGSTCKNFTWAEKSKVEKGATIRVDDVFKSSPDTGLLKDKPITMTECLIFVTIASNMQKVGSKLVMQNHPRKHIGILYQGKVWNYSNTNKKVVADLLESFKTKFTNAYKTTGTTVEFYYGKFI